MNPLKHATSIQTYYYALALLDDEDLTMSDDDLLLIAEDYADLNRVTNSSAEE